MMASTFDPPTCVRFRRISPEHPKVNWGVGFQLGVEFDGDGPDAWIAFVGAGVNFHA